MGLELYWVSFADLTTCRPVAGLGSALPIPIVSVLEYAAAFEFDSEQTASLVYFVRRMDSAFLKWMADKEKKRKKSLDGDKSKFGGTKSKTRSKSPGIGDGG